MIAHALTDAVLGAAGLGDIGSLFPSDESTPEGVDSLELLAEAYRRVRAAGFELVNADCVLDRPGAADRPAPRRDAPPRWPTRSGRLADAVNVRATTTDRLGFTGREEGLAAEAVALLRQAR